MDQSLQFFSLLHHLDFPHKETHLNSSCPQLWGDSALGKVQHPRLRNVHGNYNSHSLPERQGRISGKSVPPLICLHSPYYGSLVSNLSDSCSLSWQPAHSSQLRFTLEESFEQTWHQTSGLHQDGWHFPLFISPVIFGGKGRQLAVWHFFWYTSKPSGLSWYYPFPAPPDQPPLLPVALLFY